MAQVSPKKPHLRHFLCYLRHFLYYLRCFPVLLAVVSCVACGGFLCCLPWFPVLPAPLSVPPAPLPIYKHLIINCLWIACGAGVRTNGWLLKCVNHLMAQVRKNDVNLRHRININIWLSVIYLLTVAQVSPKKSHLRHAVRLGGWFRPWKRPVCMDEIALLPFRPWKRPVFVDGVGMPGISHYWFFLFFYFVKKTICVFCLREG